VTHPLLENTPQNKAHWEKFFADKNPPPPEPRWEAFFAGCAVFVVFIGCLIGGMALYDTFAPEIAELEVAVGQRATAVWQWVVTFGHCPVCCGAVT
jgi:hypothetical protein